MTDTTTPGGAIRATSPDGEPSDQGGEEPELKRVLGPFLLLLFIVGDIIGAGIFAVTGKIAGEVGGLAWLPFLIAFGIATLTACSYLELVTKYPQAAGAALYVHKAFGIHFVTFLVAFAVACSGITSASTSSGLLASNLLIGLNEIFPSVPTGDTASLLAALIFMLVLAAVNLRGVGESVKFNVVLTLVSIAALTMVILIGFYAIGTGEGDVARLVAFDTVGEKNLFISVTVATTIAFFAMVGFEDSVNMVEETKDPERNFPKMMFTALGVCALLYMLVAVSVIMVIPTGDLGNPSNPEAGILLDVVKVGAPGIPIDNIFPFLTVFAVGNTALINMLMASRLVYGMSKQGVLPPALGKVLPNRRSPWAAIAFTTLLALGLITYVRTQSESNIVSALSGTTGLLLLAVFAVVNVTCLVLRREDTGRGFRAPTIVPILGAVLSAFLVGPWARNSKDYIQYRIALGLLAIGVVLWGITWVLNRRTGADNSQVDDAEALTG